MLMDYSYGSYPHMHEIISSVNGKGGLYLGNIDAAEDVEKLIKNQIGAVLTVAESGDSG
jgi:hypothetical protein